MQGLPCGGPHVLQVLGYVAGQMELVCILYMSPVRDQGVGCVGHGALIVLWKPAATLTKQSALHTSDMGCNVSA